MSGPYNDAAEIYLASGLWPVPVRGKGTKGGIVTGTTGYDGTVTAQKVNGWLHPDPTARARNGRGVGYDNITIRHQLTLAIDVDQGYGDKEGVAQLAAYAEKLRLPVLPATWSSTARGDDSPSRQYIYRIVQDAKLKTKPCTSVELCNWHHRHTVCAPSIHPDTGNAYAWYLPGAEGVPPTWGERTTRYPRPELFAPLPAEWFAAFRGGVANADRNAVVVELPELMASFPAGEPDGLVRYLIAKWSDPAQHVGHDEFKNALINCFMVGREGHAGVPQLYEVLVERHSAYVAVDRPSVAAAEVRSLVSACAVIAQQKPVHRTVMGYANVDDFLLGRKTPIPVGPPPATEVVDDLTEPCTDEDVEAFLATFTTYGNPHRLARRTGWMKAEPVHRMPHHAVQLVCDALTGHYPADRAAAALIDGYRHHGVTDPRAPRTALKLALAGVLNSKAAA